MNKTQQKLFDIVMQWDENEKNMGEQAALLVACEQMGVSEEWFYDKFSDNHEVVNGKLKEYYDRKKYE